MLMFVHVWIYPQKYGEKKRLYQITAVCHHDTADPVKGTESDKTKAWQLEIVLWSARFVSLRDSGWQGR